jgi:hypothetical protein
MKAFPTEHPVTGTLDSKSDGMDLRDYFAGQALTGLLTEAQADFTDEAIADLAYSIANAMMKAREA